MTTRRSHQSYASLGRINQRGGGGGGNLMLVSYDSSGNLYQVEGSVGMLRTSASNPQITQLNHHYQQQQSRVGQPPHLIQPSQTVIQQHQQLKQASKSQVYSLSLKILFSISYGAYCLTFFPTSFAKLGNSLSSRISPKLNVSENNHSNFWFQVRSNIPGVIPILVHPFSGFI